MTQQLEEREMSYVSAGADDVRQYLSEIRQYPRLSAQEERELARRCAQGDQEAIRRMVNANLRLVVSVAGEYAGRGVPLLDLIQEGSIGLLAAARKFDHTLEYRFSTYATKWIRQGVTRCLQNHGALIRVPQHTAQQLRKVAQARKQLRSELGQEPTQAQLAESCQISQERLRRLMERQIEVCSLDVPVGDEEQSSLALLLEDAASQQPYEELVRQELSQALEGLLGMLEDRQQQVLRLHFGMADGVCHSLEEIGASLQISKERARQIEKQAMEKLQKWGADMGLEDFLNE